MTDLSDVSPPGDAAAAVGEPAAPESPGAASAWSRADALRAAVLGAVRRLAAGRLATPKVAVSLSCAGLLLLVLVGGSAPNVNTLLTRLPLSLLPSQPAWVSYPVMVAAVLLESVGLAGMLFSHARGWSPSPRLLYGLSAAFVLVAVNLTPVGSSDPASYAAYGRIAALGANPYTATPHDVLQGTGYQALIGSSWQHTPSVYGPVATWLQTAAALVGGDRPWLTIWLLQITGGAVFLAVGYLLLRRSADPVRATLLWTANPLLLQQLVVGGHLDTLVAAGTLCALRLAGGERSWWRDCAVGVVLGVAMGVKIDTALIALAFAWPLVRDHRWRRLATTGVSGAITLVGVYASYGTSALAPLSAASKLVSLPTIWDIPQLIGRATVGGAATSTVISVLWPILLLCLVWYLGRRTAIDGDERAFGVAVIMIAWILAAPWAMPWYSAPGWVALALLPRTRLTGWLAIPTAIFAMVHSSGGHAW